MLPGNPKKSCHAEKRSYDTCTALPLRYGDFVRLVHTVPVSFGSAGEQSTDTFKDETAALQ